MAVSSKLFFAILVLEIVGCRACTYEERIADLTQRIEQGDTIAYRKRALLYLKLGRDVDALHDMNYLVSFGYHPETTYVSRGLLLQNLGAYDYAALDYSECIALGSRKLLALRGRCYMLLKEFPEAIADFEAYIHERSVVSQDTSIDYAHTWLGECKTVTGDYAGAIKEWKTLLGSTKWDAAEEIVGCLCALRDLRSAKMFLDSLWADSAFTPGRRAEDHYIRGVISAKLGRYEDAIVDLRVAESYGYFAPLSRFHLALVYEALRDSASAFSNFQEAIERGFSFRNLVVHHPRLLKILDQRGDSNRTHLVEGLLAQALAHGKILSDYQADIARDWMLATFADAEYDKERRNLRGSAFLWDEERARYTITPESYPCLRPEVLLSRLRGRKQ